MEKETKNYHLQIRGNEKLGTIISGMEDKSLKNNTRSVWTVRKLHLQFNYSLTQLKYLLLKKKNKL